MSAPPQEQVPPAAAPSATVPRRGAGAAALVAAGILLSRVVGLVRQRVFGHWFGTSDAGDAFTAAFRIPNFLQNVLGEGVLSASFIPVYAGLLGRGDEAEADRLASAIFSLLVLALAVLVLVGVATTPWLVDTIAGGFAGPKRELTIRLVRVLFPGAALLSLSAWCIGILNSHRRFFLSYAAPVVWSLAMIATLAWFGPRLGAGALDALTVRLAWGSVVGSALMLAAQFPSVLSLLHRLQPHVDAASPHVRAVARSFLPVFVSRGVVQLSAFVDQGIASHLGTGAVSALLYAQTIALLPVSLFGMAVSVAELPEMARAQATRSEALAGYLQERLNAGMRRIAFYVVPSAAAFLLLGDVLVAALYQTGRFGRGDTFFVWMVLAGSAVGLLASSLGRLDASTYYAMRDTRTPFRVALLRVLLTFALGLLFAFPLRRALGLDLKWGAVGLTASMGIAGWIEFAVLRGMLNRRIGRTGLPAPYMVRLWIAALVAGAAGYGLKVLLAGRHPILVAAGVVPVYGLLYLGITSLFGIEEVRAFAARFTRRLGRRPG